MENPVKKAGRTALGIVLLLVIFWGCAVGCQPNVLLQRIAGQSKSVQIELNAQMMEEQINDYIQGRWENILFHIYFAPDNTAFVHAELKNDYLSELFQIPGWIAATLPEKLYLDMQFVPYLQDKKVRLETKSLQLNASEMPPIIGETLCAALSERINQALEKEGIVIKELSISGEMLRIETEKSSGQ